MAWWDDSWDLSGSTDGTGLNLMPTQTQDATPNYGQVLAAMNPGMTGLSSLPNSAFNATSPLSLGGGTSTSGQPLSQKLADALGQLSKPGQVQQNQAPQQGRLNLNTQMPQSTFSRGGSENLSTLVQMLLSRANQYGPPTASSSSGRGLLGT